MKKLILAAALISGSVMANDGEATQEQKLEFCKSLSQMARSIMDARQSGVEMSQMVEMAMDNDMKSVILPVVKMAYEESRYSTPGNQEKSIQDFGNLVYSTCIKETGAI